MDTQNTQETETSQQGTKHPLIGTTCVFRTYSAGVHVGNLVWVDKDNPCHVRYKDGFRIHVWEGALALGTVASTGITGGKTEHVNECVLTEVIEMLPATEEALATFEKFIQDFTKKDEA